MTFKMLTREHKLKCGVNLHLDSYLNLMSHVHEANPGSYWAVEFYKCPMASLFLWQLDIYSSISIDGSFVCFWHP